MLVTFWGNARHSNANAFAVTSICLANALAFAQQMLVIDEHLVANANAFAMGGGCLGTRSRVLPRNTTTNPEQGVHGGNSTGNARKTVLNAVLAEDFPFGGGFRCMAE